MSIEIRYFAISAWDPVSTAVIEQTMWEIERHNWSSFRACGDASRLPGAIKNLICAIDEASANGAYWMIDNRAVVQGAVYESALPTVACLTRSLLRAEPVARARILELLAQICGGTAALDEQNSGNSNIAKECLQELVWCSSSLFEILEIGTEEEQEWCVDLLGLVALFERRLVQPVIDLPPLSWTEKIWKNGSQGNVQRNQTQEAILHS